MLNRGEPETAVFAPKGSKSPKAQPAPASAGARSSTLKPPSRESRTRVADNEPGPKWDFGKVPIFPPEGEGGSEAPPPPYPGLPCGREFAFGDRPGDPSEREADRVAAQVMRTPEPIQPAFSGAPDAAEQTPAPPIVRQVLRSPSQPLDEGTRAFMEPRFGIDLSRVQVHRGAAAEESARAVSAKAYTVGEHIVFARSRFQPETHTGRQLIAHELAHVVQPGPTPRLHRKGEKPDKPEGHGTGCELAPPLSDPALAKLKPAGRDRAIGYSIGLARGTFCEMPPKSIALLQYKREVHIRTAWGLEATLHMKAFGAYFPAKAIPGVPPFDPAKSSVEQLRQLGWASVTWDVEVNYAGIDQKAMDIQVPDIVSGWHSLLQRPRNVLTEKKAQSLAELAGQERDLVHFFLSPEAQQNSLEEFATLGACAEIPKLCKAVEVWKAKHPQHPTPKSEPARPKEQKRPVVEEPLDDVTFNQLSEEQKYDLARKQIWQRTKEKLAYMWHHPGETLKGLGASLLLLNAPETFRAMGENLTEFLDEDADPLARAAAGTGFLSKLLGWLAGVAIVLGTVLYIASWLTGIGEAATIIGLAIAAATVLFAGSIGLGAGESVLRAKAASKSKTVAEFNHHVEEGSSSLANGIAGIAMLAAAAVVHAVVKGLVPKDVQQKIGTLLDDFRKRLKKSAPKAAPKQPPSTPGPDVPSDQKPAPQQTQKPAPPDVPGKAPAGTDQPGAGQQATGKTQQAPPKTTEKPPKQSGKVLDVHRRERALRQKQGLEKELKDRPADVTQRARDIKQLRQDLDKLLAEKPKLPQELKNSKAFRDLPRLGDEMKIDERIEGVRNLREKLRAENQLSPEADAYLQWEEKRLALEKEIRGSKDANATDEARVKQIEQTEMPLSEAELRAASRDIADLVRNSGNGPNYTAKGKVAYDEVMGKDRWEARKAAQKAGKGQSSGLQTDHLFAVDQIANLPQLQEFLSIFTKASEAVKARMVKALGDLGDLANNLVRMDEKANNLKSNKLWQDIPYGDMKDYYTAPEIDAMRAKEAEALKSILDQVAKDTDEFRAAVEQAKAAAKAAGK